MLIGDERVDLAGLIGHVLLHVGVEVKLVLEELVQIKVGFENVLARVEAQLIRIFFDNVLKDIAMGRISHNPDVRRFKFVNLFGIPLVFFAKFRVAKSRQ